MQVQCEVVSVEYAVCSMECAVWSMQCVVCSVQCGVCCVQWSEKNGLIDVCREAGGREEYITKQNMEEALTLMRNNIVQEIR